MDESNVQNTEVHSQRMQKLVSSTKASFATPYPSPFGAEIYNSTTGESIAFSIDTVLRNNDPTNHAEVNAIRLACAKLNQLSLKGYILYSTCEPCPMCMSACIWAELDAVVFGAVTSEDADPYWPQLSDLRAIDLVKHSRLVKPLVVVGEVQRAACQDLFRKCDATRKELELRLPPNR